MVWQTPAGKWGAYSSVKWFQQEACFRKQWLTSNFCRYTTEFISVAEVVDEQAQIAHFVHITPWHCNIKLYQLCHRIGNMNVDEKTLNNIGYCYIIWKRCSLSGIIPTWQIASSWRNVSTSRRVPSTFSVQHRGGIAKMAVGKILADLVANMI